MATEGAGMLGANGILGPGMLVRHPGRPDWGTGQVQSRVGDRITVGFEHAGKVVIDGTRIELELLPLPDVGPAIR
jgi:hypothetical protein